jgi:serine/threonine protein kinase
MGFSDQIASDTVNDGATCRRRVFISYAHEDSDWKDRFERMLAPATGGNLALWSDGDILAGADWQETIERELGAASIALVLVSDHFLASEFVNKVELPQILDRHRHAGMKLYWVPLTPALFNESPFSTLQSPWPVDSPLLCLDEAGRARAIQEICSRLVKEAGSLARLNEVRHGRLQTAVQAAAQRWHITITRLLGSGDAAVTYLGEMDRKQVVVKALIEGPTRGMLQEIAQELERVRSLRDACFSRLEHVMPDGDPPCLVLEYVQAGTVATVLRQGPFDVAIVLRLIRRLARALSEYHRTGLRYGPLDVDDIFVDAAGGMLRLPAVNLSNRRAVGDEINAGFPRSLRAATHLAPECYAGQAYTSLTDQYALGLLAVEMLLGVPPVVVRRAADLEQKKRFFDDPASVCAASIAALHPGLASVILQLLASEPTARFSDMDAVAQALGSLESAAHSLATQSYGNHCMDRPAFYAAFYARFFRRCPRASALFENTDLARQYTMLENALQLLLNGARNNPIEARRLQSIALARGHRDVSPDELDLFTDCLLETLSEEALEPPQVINAWREVMRQGLAVLGGHMKRADAGGAR